MRRLLPVVVAAALCGGCEKPPVGPAPPPEVAVGPVVQRDVPIYVELVGQTSGGEDVEIRARVEGYVERVAYQEGTFIRKGDLLYVIDPKPLEATLAEAKADLAIWQARLDKSNNDVNRYTPLAKIQAVSQQELDNAIVSRQAAIAQVDAGKAAVEKATLNLSYTRVRSPIDGLIGTTRVKQGALVGRGENTLLTTVSTIDPVVFRAGVAEAEYLRIRQQLQQSRAAATLQTVRVELLLADGTRYAHEGHMEFADRAVDTSTGTLMLQFRFPNPERLLRPGQYGRARFVIDRRVNALLVPQRAVAETQGTYNVAVVGPDGAVAFRSVKVGPRVESMWVIEEGVKPGERVVVEGLQRIKDGIKVTPREASEHATVPSGDAK